MIQEEVEIDLKSLVAAGLYESEEKAMYEALKLLLKENPEIRKKLAIFRYKNTSFSLMSKNGVSRTCCQLVCEF